MDVKEKSADGDYPLHSACEENQLEEVVIRLIDGFPQAAMEEGKDGDYPLHLACKYNQSSTVIFTLLDLNLMAARTPIFAMIYQQQSFRYN
jgi:ankyrin repeat protein